MKLTMILLLVGMMQVSASVYSQNGKLNVEVNEMELSELLWQLQEESGIVFVYKTEDLHGVEKVTVNKQSASIENVLDEVLEGTGLEYVLNEDVVTIRKKQEERYGSQQTEKRILKGKVVDEKGNPLPGVTVVVQGTMVGTATDFKGKFQIQVKPSDALRFTFVGYKDQIILVKGKEKLDVQMASDAQNIDEVTVVAFGEQKKESVVSSITSVKSEALKSSSADLTTSLAGAMPGIIGWQTGGVPGAAMTEKDANVKFYIRGITSFQKDANINPLVLLDGVEISILDLARIDPDDIETFNVLKDASATAMYGARGANGVIYVKTKRGKAGNVYSTVRYEVVMSEATKELDVVDPIDFMKFYNQALIGRNPSAMPKYTAEKISRTASGKYPDYVYPAVNWYKKMFKNRVPNHRFGLTVRGGSDKIQYYASINHKRDKGMIKTDKLNQYDVNVKSNTTSFRTNLNINMSKTSKLIISSFSTLDNRNDPAMDTRTIYQVAFQADPVSAPAVFPDDGKHSWKHVRFGEPDIGGNPYALVHGGYKTQKRFSTMNNFEYIQNLNFITKGLEMRLSGSMTKTGYFIDSYSTVPHKYRLGSYDHNTGNHSLILLNRTEARRTLEYDYRANSSDVQTTLGSEAKFMYNTNWGDHTASGVAVMTMQEKKTSTPSDLLNSLPQRNLGYALRGTYGYKNKYFLEASFGYNGSERFAKKNQMGFFPAFGLAWIPSRENFMAGTKNWLDQLKFRFSYGKVGNDGVIRNPRYVYVQQLEDTQSMDFGITKRPLKGLGVRSYENPKTTWEISEQANLGTEVKLLNNLIDMKMDIYQITRHNIYSYRTTVPGTLGLFQYPLDNVGKVRARGLDLQVSFRKSFNKDFYFVCNGNFTYSKAKYLRIEEPSGKPSYQRKKGRDISQQFGYIAEGLFRDNAEILSSPTQAGNIMPGDIKYRDINEDGKIDLLDVVPIGHPTTPRIIYGFNTFVHYKNFEFNMSFQGMGDRSFWINPKEVSPFHYNRALLTAFAKDHWSPTNRDRHALWPRLSTQNITEHNPQEDYYPTSGKDPVMSTFFMRNGKFLRCKNIELSYYIGKNFLKKYKIKKCKLYARVNNAFVISDFKLWDVELGGEGFNYPIQRTYSMGINVSF